MIMNKILHQITAEPETLWSGACPKPLLSRYHCKKRGCISFSCFRKEKKEKYTFNSMEIYSDNGWSTACLSARPISFTPLSLLKGGQSLKLEQHDPIKGESIGDNVYAKICKNWSLICVTSFIHSTPYIILRVLVKPGLDRTRNLNLFPRQRTWMHGQLITCSLNFV